LNLFGENHSTVATSMNNLASLYEKIGDLPKAEDFFLKSIKIFRMLLGENHHKVATGLHNLASLHTIMGQKNES